eukprot:6202284-Pleurochrysis_carterae.AAC.2
MCSEDAHAIARDKDSDEWPIFASAHAVLASFCGLNSLVVDHETGANYTPNWVERNSTLILLGIPIGNTANINTFLKAKCKGAKMALTRAHSIASISLIGRTRILNANYYGKVRHYMWTLQFPPWLIKAAETYATHFTWNNKSSLDTDAIGTAGGNGKYVSKYATHGTIRRGGDKCTSPHTLKPFKRLGYCGIFTQE